MNDRFLGRFENLSCNVYCERAGTSNLLQELRALNAFVVNVTAHILSRTERLEKAIVEKFRELHFSHDQETRFWVCFCTTILTFSGCSKHRALKEQRLQNAVRPASVFSSSCLSSHCPLLECAP